MQQSSLPQLNDTLPSARLQSAIVIKDSTKYPSKTRLNTRRKSIIKVDSTRELSLTRLNDALPSAKRQPAIVIKDSTKDASKARLNTRRKSIIKVDSTRESSLTRLNDTLPSAQRQHTAVTKDSTKYSSKTRPNARRTSNIKADTTKYSSRQRPKVTLPPAEKAKEEKIVEGPASSTLQFGSFENRKNAEILAKKISYNAAVEIVQKGQTYKVQLKTHYRSSEEAEAAAKRLPVNSIVVPSK
jgi:hypothetical protein